MKKLSVVPLDVKYGSPINFDMFSSSRRNVGSIGNIALVDTLGGLDNLVQPRGDLWRWYPSAENVSSRNGRSVEISVGVLSLDEHGSLQRKSREETCEPQAHKSQNQSTNFTDPRTQAVIRITHLSIWSTKTSGRGGPNSLGPLLQFQWAQLRRRCFLRSLHSRRWKTPLLNLRCSGR